MQGSKMYSGWMVEYRCITLFIFDLTLEHPGIIFDPIFDLPP